MLEIKNLHVAIEDGSKKILNGLTLTVHRGEVAAIMGPNGSGKSTLSYVIAGKPGYEVLDGEILLETADAVRETLIAHMDEDELVAATGQLDTDEIADLAPDLPREVILDVFKSLSTEEREQLREAMSYPEEAVGALMDFEMIEVREDVNL